MSDEQNISDPNLMKLPAWAIKRIKVDGKNLLPIPKWDGFYISEYGEVWREPFVDKRGRKHKGGWRKDADRYGKITENIKREDGTWSTRQERTRFLWQYAVTAELKRIYDALGI